MSAEPAPRLTAALREHYRIERQLGEGGMATVYLAEDLKHGRNVALKVLKPELAAVVGAERFLAEIQTTAKLQHPHVLPLHDSGEADGLLYYVMPYVEGESLRDRLDRERQLPVDEAVRIATDLAEALGYAHRQGVIHRDIKPANIMMHEGRPLIADFGIALAVGAAGGSRLTETGLSVGTPYYMSPEQATGDSAVGPRSDTYALGCVLYEMLTGDPPHIGSTAQAVLGKIIQGVPVSATAVRKSVPPNVDAAIRKALEKLPADRFTDAQGFAKALADPGFRHGEAAGAVAAGGGVWNRLSVALAGASVLLAAAFGWALTRPPPEIHTPVERFASPFLEGQEPRRGVPIVSYALSPDGSMLVYMGPSTGGGPQLWLRRWEDLEASPIPGTEGGMGPAVSPDGLELVFWQEREWKILSLLGGPVRSLLSIGDHLAWARWGSDGYVYTSTPDGIVRVLPSGGPVETVQRLDGDENTGALSFYDLLPGGETALMMSGVGGAWDSEIKAVDLKTGEIKPLAFGLIPHYATSNHLVFLSPGENVFDGTLMAARFDPETVELLGPQVPIVTGVEAFTLSATGKLFYSRPPNQSVTLRELVWVTRTGEATPVHPGWTFDRGGANAGFSLSPDGRHVALRAMGDDGPDIWIKELDDGGLRRLTNGEGEERFPRWSHDGQRVTYLYGGPSGGLDVFSRPANGTGDQELLFDHDVTLAQGFYGPDGEWLILRTISAGASIGRDILAVRPGIDSAARPLLVEEYGEGAPALSPDGRWLAYNSDETGRYEVYVRPFPDVDTDKVLVSAAGGIAPLWAHSGSELFYVDGDNNMVAAKVETDPGFRIVERQTLFPVPPGTMPRDNQFVTGLYDIAPDDQRFLMARIYVDPNPAASPEPTEAPSAPRAILVQNFFEVLKELAGN